MVSLVSRPGKTIQHRRGFANKSDEECPRWVGSELWPDALSDDNVNRRFPPTPRSWAWPRKRVRARQAAALPRTHACRKHTIVLIRKMSEAGGLIDPTPTECWKGAVFYYNPNDAALFVEKRDGWGYMLNFANRWSWALLLLLVLVIASGRFVLP